MLHVVSQLNFGDELSSRKAVISFVKSCFTGIHGLVPIRILAITILFKFKKCFTIFAESLKNAMEKLNQKKYGESPRHSFDGIWLKQFLQNALV